MNVLICSKYKYHAQWATIKSILESRGHTCTTPLDIDLELHDKTDKEMTGTEYLRSVARFHKLITDTDILYVLNFDGEFGKSMMLEIGYAAALGKEIICLESFESEPSLANFVTKIAEPTEI